ncbi:EF-hand domain-containing protein [Aquimarina litoralis]|uniref:EF-hand domain-containing protein n=1 Tax=Aquimarina litoralis TaxID=584605 RepID=UPI001C57AA6D|nr:EF-hand domain-containing protein [Aquimarina litoralis]MBW1296490.1 EF-hand domain-containing protein [Aquimarina litoralis]
MKSNLFNLGLIMTGVCLLTSCHSNAQSNDQKRPNRERPSVEEIFEMMDANEDGKLSKEEVKGPLKRDFTKIDLDEDGLITREELEKAPKPERKGPPRNN